jgi:uncharacterized protein YaiL (DUF2058 family)
MADSLREQLIAAGLAPPEEKKKKRPARGADKRKRSQAPGGAKHRGKQAANRQQTKPANNTDAEKAAAAEIEERKKLKAKIKAIIEANRIDKWQGDVPYRYQVGTKLRELYVTEDLQKKLAARELAITRLNGSTYIVPATTAAEIVELNPLWTVFNSANGDQDSKPDTKDDDGDYSQFEVPDDLTW